MSSRAGALRRAEPSTDMEAFQSLLRSSKRIIAVAGAGLSAASGIPTFRGAGGMWRKYDAMSLATPDAFDEDPVRVWQFYHYRREKARAAQPNAAHYTLAKFSIDSERHKIAPESTFTLVTQNVDGLSRRALDETYASLGIPIPTTGPPEMLEMHGRIFDVKCSSDNDEHTVYDPSSPICEALRGTEELVEAGSTEPVILEGALPHCATCGELARPGVVWFGEMPLHLDEIDDLVKSADLCIVVGTSSTVYPAASYASTVRKHGGKVAVFNLEHSTGDDKADFLFLGPCENTLPKALGV
ncbi:hypothetical protein EIP91_011105 [Steccherinum ochraceum]|uniref:NAD-dependent protein deacylase n=1 Tax=Steccherinum ochraceum TaxID=92696 RepID=A0A4R0S3L3_9APHY|nr:hypothetical protein EIP91_011105 [Steccherinum ochraceum]